MEAFQALPGWAQLLIALVAAAVLVVLNVGWLMQARGWMKGQQQKLAAKRLAARERAEAARPKLRGSKP
jgi:hypothetical protein